MKAWIENAQIRDIAQGDPFVIYHPDIAKLYDTEVPDDAVNGDGWVDGELIKPTPYVPPEPPPAPPPIIPRIPLIGPIAFQMLFTVEELIAIDAAKEDSPAIRIFWGLLNDPRTDVVDRNLQPVQSMIDSLETTGLIGQGRAAQIIHEGLV